MAKISVIVPIYGVEKYLRECLDSIINQTFRDLEIILIDDGGKDNCPQIIDEYAQKDERIIAIHKENGGYGRACNVGLDRASGEYISIIEPDDYIKENMFADLYKIAEEYGSDIVKSGFYDNLQSKSLTRCKKAEFSEDIPIDRSFQITEYPYFLIYHPSIWSCLYRRAFLKKHNIRFAEVPGAGWSDNPFQVQTMCLAERINYTPEGYYYWRRLNENESDDLKDYMIPFRRCDEIHEWLDENNISDENILACLYVRELNYIKIVLGMLRLRDIQPAFRLIKLMLKRMDKNIVYHNKFVDKRRKKFYTLVSGLCFAAYLNEVRRRLISVKWNKKEKSVKVLGRTFSRMFNGDKQNIKIKIIQVFHKDFIRIKSPIILPMHVGRALSNIKTKELLQDMIGDDSYKDNISDQNNIYCELTAQYYAWKNSDFLKELEYVGFMHYRRVFNFNNKNIKNLNYTRKQVYDAINGFDIILPEKLPCYSKLAQSYVDSVKIHWDLERKYKDLNKIYERTIELYPEYKESFDQVLNKDSIYWYNMFIMKSDLFKTYSSWLFNILNIDVELFDEQLRIKGYLAEILLNVFIEKNKNTLKIKEIPTVKIELDNYVKNSFLENIFSVKNQISGSHRKYKVITCLGIKFKFPAPFVKKISYTSIQDGNTIYADSLMLAFNKQINSIDFLDFNKELIKLISIDKCTQDEFLIYIDSLIKNNETKTATELLNQYIIKYGFSGIWSFYDVAEFAKNNGLVNDLNGKVCQVYECLLSEKSKYDFKNLIENKTVAIVGNGPSEKNTNHGKEIDAHDIVIRMNNYKIEGFEKDYGTKCDIWARGIGASDVLDKTKQNNFKACLYAADITKFKLSYALYQIIERDLKKTDLISIAIDSATATEIKKESHIYFPTTGFNTILYIIKTCNPKKVDCYGFSFNQKKVDGFASHYFNDRIKKEAIKRSLVHDFNKESVYLRQVLELGVNTNV